MTTPARSATLATMDYSKKHVDALGQLAQLRAELDGIATAIDAAQRATDVAEWLRLRTRATDLPGEIDAAELAAIALETDAAYTEVERLAAIEAETATALDDAHAQLKQLRSKTPPAPGTVAAAHHGVDIATAADTYRAATTAHTEAQDTTGCAWWWIDQLEARLLTLDPSATVDADGPRALPPALTASVTVAPDRFGTLASEAARLGPLLEVGTIPPRWIAHRLGPHAFEPVRPATQPSPADLARARDHFARLADLDLGIPAKPTYVPPITTDPDEAA